MVKTDGKAEPLFSGSAWQPAPEPASGQEPGVPLKRCPGHWLEPGTSTHGSDLAFQHTPLQPDTLSAGMFALLIGTFLLRFGRTC